MDQAAALDITSTSLRHDAQIVGVVGIAHALSHFFQLILPTLFPWIKAEFNVSYAELGLLMTAFFVASGIGQTLAGFLVDRSGPRPILFAGTTLLALAALGMANAQHYATLIFFAGVAGLGNSIFHPADFTLLNNRVSKTRLGHAFSAHSVTGFLGWAAAPVFGSSLTLAFSWRGALLGAALLALAVLVLLWCARARLMLAPEHHVHAAHDQATAQPFAFLRLPLVWMCFTFFFITSMAFSGVQTFVPSALQHIYAIPPLLAMTSLTIYMLASAGGTIAGGFLSAKTTAHDKIIALAFTIAGALALLVASGVVPTTLVLLLIGVIGFTSGVASPSRDMLVRAASPNHATGRVYGVVYSGMDCGQALGPLLFGALMDAQHPQWVFVAIGLFQFLAVFTATGVGRGTAKQTT